MLRISKKQLVYKCTQERTTGRWIFRNSSVAWLLVHFLFRFNISRWITFSYRVSTSRTRHNCRKKCQRSFASMDDQKFEHKVISFWTRVWEYNLVKILANAVLFLSWNGPGFLFVLIENDMTAAHGPDLYFLETIPREFLNPSCASATCLLSPFKTPLLIEPDPNYCRFMPTL